MPRFFFELRDGNSQVHDHEGQEFRDPAEAQMHAGQVAYELARNHLPATLVDRFLVLLDDERNDLVAISLKDVNENGASPLKTLRLVQ